MKGVWDLDTLRLVRSLVAEVTVDSSKRKPKERAMTNSRPETSAEGRKATPARRRIDRARVSDAARHVKRVVATLIVLAILAGVGFVALSLARGSWMVTPVLSGSMRPGFPVGGVVVSQREPLKDIAVRDVIVFQNPIKRTEQMIHRIIKLTRLPDGAIKIKTQGDANTIPDPWTVEIHTRLVYRVRWSLPLLGYVAIAYQNHRGLLLAIAGLVLLLVAAGMLLRSGSKKKATDQAQPPAPELPEPRAIRQDLSAQCGASTPEPDTVRELQLAATAPTESSEGGT